MDIKQVLGLITSPVDLRHLSRISTAKLSRPAYYDLRTLNKVTPIKDQGYTGSCWAFATYASLESYLLPVANFSATPTSGNKPQRVAFRDTSTGLPASWNWSFGDGTGSTVKNPVHVYNKAGKYTVTLKVSNAAGNNTMTKTDYITVTALKLPVAAFTANRISGKAPLTVTFNDRSTGSPGTWYWNFGDGKYSTTNNPSHVYAKPGKYTVTLTVSNAAGRSTKTMSNYINVNK